MNTESIQYQADHAEMRPAVNVTRMGKLWRITWGEPRNGHWPLWHAYQQHCQADLVPRLRSAWPGWCSLVGKGSRMAMASGSFGFLHYAPEEVAHEAVEIIRAVFPHAVVTWPKARASRQRCDRCRHMSPARTCAAPDAAGLAALRLPVWCDLMGGHGRTCPAFRSIAGT